MVFPGPPVPPSPIGQGSWAPAAVSQPFLLPWKCEGPFFTHSALFLTPETFYSFNYLTQGVISLPFLFPFLTFPFFLFFFFFFFSWIMHSCNTSCGFISNAMELPRISHSLCMHKALLFHRSTSGPGSGSSHFSLLAFQRCQHWASQELHPALGCACLQRGCGCISVMCL